MNSQYKRVSRHRTCLICGKPDWCSYTPDAKISFCARIINNADRVSRTGWGVFYHEKSLFADAPLPFPAKSPPKKAELAPIEIRDFAYRKLIELAPATDSKEIIDGEKGLRARKILAFENYGALPQTRATRQELAREIRRLINRKFPDFVRRQKSGVDALPGFWLDKSGRSQLWLEKDYACPMMLIPYRAPGGLVQACQIRFMGRKLAKKQVRYVWLSTPDKSGGISCGSPLHFASYDALSLDKPVLITEGALKAETTLMFKSDYDIMASAGVACSHEEIAAAARSRPVFIAFDSDYYENIHVARALARLVGFLWRDSVNSGIQPRINILAWKPEIKGIDDALLQKAFIEYKSPFEWLKSLNYAWRDEIARILPKLCIPGNYG